MSHHLPHSHDATQRPSRRIEPWARQEAKSDAKIDDVRASTSAVSGPAAKGNSTERLDWAAGLGLGLVTLALATAIILFAGLPRDPDGKFGQDQTVASDASGDRAEGVPRFWGPFRP
jgi:hypothetical protein